MLVYTGSGVANYTFNLIKALLIHAPENEYRVFYSSRRVPKDTKKMLNTLENLGAKVYRYPIPPWVLKIIWNKFQIIPIEWLIGKVDYLHSSDFLRPPLQKGTKGITTVHDLTWKKFPEFHIQDVINGHTRKLNMTIQGSDIIICDSQNTKKDLLEYYPNVEKTNKVTVIYPGVDERFRPMKQEEYEPTLHKYGLRPQTKYLLYVGAIEPRKNLPLTIDVFNELIKDEKYSDYQLMLVGRAGWKNEEVFRKITDLGLEDKVRFVGYVDDEDLPAIYNGAKCLLYLSKYEGFGLPPLESLSCGIPVLCSKNSSLIELIPLKYLVNIGNSALVLKKILMEIITEISSTHSQKVSSMYNWANMAKQILIILKEEA